MGEVNKKTRKKPETSPDSMSGMFLCGSGGQRAQLCLKSSQLLSMTAPGTSVINPSNSRSVTDITHYKSVETSHLHDFGQKSERTRFLEKIKKLEEAAEIKAKMGTVEEVHRPVEKPPGWKPIKLPRKIQRDPTSVLKSMASVVGKDPTAPAYQYHDDPYLIPYNFASKSQFLLAKDSGRKAARYILDRHPELFEKNLIEMQPVVKRFMPRVLLSKKNASLELLENYITSFNVVQAMETYQFLEEKGKTEAMDISLKQKLLELVCYHNEAEEYDEESFRELWGTYDHSQSSQESQGFVDKLSNEIQNCDGSSAEDKWRARVAVLCGHAKHGANIHASHKYVTDTYQQLKDGGEVCLDLNVFNHVILSFANSTSVYEEKIDEAEAKVKEILTDMKDRGVRPDVQTLCNYLKMIASFKANTKGQARPTHLLGMASAVMSEFRNVLGVEPSLGCYHYYAKSGTFNEVYEYVDAIHALEKSGKKLEVVIPEDFLFFKSAMFALQRSNRRDIGMDAVYRLHKLAMTNEAVLGDLSSVQDYYNDMLRKMIQLERLDVAMDFYNRSVPHTCCPHISAYTKIFQAMELEGGWKHMPRVWTDLVSSQFSQGSGNDYKIKTFQEVLEAMTSSDLMDFHSRSSEEDHKTFQNFVSVATEMTGLFLKWTDTTRRNSNIDISSTHTIQFLNLCLKVVSAKVLRYDEVVAADFQSQCHLMEVAVSNDMNLCGTVEEETLWACLDNCLEERSSEEAMKIVRYAAGNNTSNSMDLATALVNSQDKVKLTENHRGQINKLFSHETKWAPV